MNDIGQGHPLIQPTADGHFLDRQACPVCFAASPEVLFNRPYTDPKVRGFVTSHYEAQGQVDYRWLDGLDLMIYKCSTCSLIFQRMAPIGPMLDAIYNQFHNAATVHGMDQARLTMPDFVDVSRRLQVVFERVGKPLTALRMLDFGMGYGRWARVAVAMGVQVFATEISPEKIALARSIGVQVLSEDELPHHRFEVIHAEQVFEHLAAPAEMFRLLSGCLAEGGVFKIAVPKQGRLELLLRRHGFIDRSPWAATAHRSRTPFSNLAPMADYQSIVPLEHVNSFRRSSIEALARPAGFRVERGSFAGRYVDLDLGSLAGLAASGGAWAVRLAKDIYNLAGPGRDDTSCYFLFSDKK